MEKLKRSKQLANQFKTIFKFIFQFCFALFLFLNTILVLPLGVFLFLPLKTFVYICAKIFRRDLLNFVSSPSSAFTIEDITTRPKMNLVVFFVADGHIEIDKFRECVQNRIIKKKLRPGSNLNSSQLMYPELKQYWTTFLNYMFWKADENFELANHVRLYDYGQANGQGHDLEDGGDPSLPDIKDGRYIDESDLNRIMGPLVLEPWKKGQSPWEMLLIHNFKSNQNFRKDDVNAKPSTVVVFRLHHGLADGYSIIKLFVRDLALTPPNIRINFPRIKIMWKKIGFSLILPFKMCWDLAGSVITAYDGTTSWHGPKKTFKLLTNLSNSIDGQVIKSIKNKYGVNYNAVLVAAVGASCKRLMKDAGQIVPKDMACFTPMPLSGHPDGVTNHATFDFLKCPLTSTITREERLRKLSKQMSRSKYYTAPLGWSWIAKYNNIVPNFMIKCSIQIFALFAVGISSFPGPQTAFYFSGMGVNFVEMIGGIGPGAGTAGFIVAAISMNGKQRFTSIIDKSIFNSEKLFQNIDTYIEEELVALLEGESSEG